MIEIENLTQQYRNKPVLNNVCLKIEKNERCGLIGRNGAGKSTLIHSILHLIPVKQGAIRLGGYSHDKEEWKRVVAYLPEKFQLYPQLTCKENMIFFASLDKHAMDEQRIEEKLRAVGLWESREEPVKNFSKGMLQRLGLGIMLYFESEILILDEPTSGLDPIGRKEILSILGSLHDKTILFSSHHMDEIKQICTHIAYLENGQIRKMPAMEYGNLFD